MMNAEPGNLHQTISYNTAGGNGGGMYNEDGWIDLTFGNIAHNEAGYGIGNSGNGGGIYGNNTSDYGQPTIRLYSLIS